MTGPEADALLLAAWLRTRLKREFELVHRPAKTLRRVVVDGRGGRAAAGARADAERPALRQLDVFGRDPIYEAAVKAIR